MRASKRVQAALPHILGAALAFGAFAALAALVSFFTQAAVAKDHDHGALDGYSPAIIVPNALRRLFPEAPGALTAKRRDASPPGWTVSSGAGTVGYIVSTYEISRSIGYSGQPIDILVGISPEAKITSAELLRNSEPVLTLGISTEDITKYVKGFAGFDLKGQPVAAFKDDTSLPPIIARATVTTGVIRDAILRTSRTAALELGLIGTPSRSIDRLNFAERTWNDLLAEGAVGRLLVPMTLAAQRFGAIANPLPAGDGTFIEIWLAVLDPPTIGQNLLGQKVYGRVVAMLSNGDAAILVASNGLHSHRGTSYLQTGLFERLEVVQANKTHKIRKDDYLRVDALAVHGAPPMNEISVFRMPASGGFQAAEPFRLDVHAERERSGGDIAAARFSLPYELPAEYVSQRDARPDDTTEEPLWISAWKRKSTTVVLVAALIAAVAVALFGQEWLVRRPTLWLRSRAAFLIFVLFFLGWYANGQLSVVQVVAFFHSLLNGFRWETFLIEPVIFILWSFVALGLLFWGRGVYCGWLCPFGALQELLNVGAKRIGIKQIEVPFSVQERLWAIKYTLFVVILALSFYSMDYALRLAEVEPFKTAISMRFMRAWPFVLFVVALLIAGLFIERFYCRYLCPLGAALAIPAKIKLFDWLHRRPQCGRECRFCETQCTVGAIDQLGRINPNECVLCFRCQVIMNDNAQCIVLKRRGARSEGLSARSAGEAAKRET